MASNDSWFIEHFDHTGSAIGFRITASQETLRVERCERPRLYRLGDQKLL